MLLKTKTDVSAFYSTEPRLSGLVELCKTEMGASEVWLFGSRARGDHAENSDWDVMAIINDDAPDRMTHPETLWSVKRKVDLPLDLVAVKQSDFLTAQDAMTTLSYEVKSEGVRIDV